MFGGRWKSMQKLLSAALSLLVIFSLMAAMESVTVSAKPLDEYNVLILKNSDAWGSPTIESTLQAMNITYTVMSSSELQNVTTAELVKNYDMIIIASDQSQTFYNEIGPQMGKLEDYVRAGRTLEIHAANWGWSGGLWTTTLPRNVTIVRSYSNRDYVTANNTTLYSSYASHGYLANLPADAEIVTVQAPSGTPDYSRPSTAIYPLGSGRIFITGLTIEYSVARKGADWKRFYAGVIKDNLMYSGKGPAATPAVRKGIDFMSFNFYYYLQYKRTLAKFNALYTNASNNGIDNEILKLAATENATALHYYEHAGRHGPVVQNFGRVYIFLDIRKAALHQRMALRILEEGMKG